ncbi:MAG: hypothetical protein SGBAC_011763 [Bacillariaceae sp.]
MQQFQVKEQEEADGYPPIKRSNFSSASRKKKETTPKLRLKDAILPCHEHLDPDGSILARSEWVHVNGTLPITSVEEVIEAFETHLLREAEMWGIVDLEAPWNPVEEAAVPTLSLDPWMTEDGPLRLVEAAHVVISPYGRPNGWYLKFPNRSLANALLSRAQQEHFHMAWKVVQLSQHQYDPDREQEQDYAYQNGLVVDDSMVRVENCPPGMRDEDIQLRLSRFDLAPEGKTVIHWKGRTNDGKRAPLMFVVRFASAAWARAAIREMQGLRVNGKSIKMIQYPNQLRYKEREVKKEEPTKEGNDDPETKTSDTASDDFEVKAKEVF